MECGQTVATTVNYLKNLRTFFNLVTRQYIYVDPYFPQCFDGGPCPQTVMKIKILDQKLGLLYRQYTKKQPEELFA